MKRCFEDSRNQSYKTFGMSKRDWGELEVLQGILREPSPEENRLIVWIPETIAGR